MYIHNHHAARWISTLGRDNSIDLINCPMLSIVWSRQLGSRLKSLGNEERFGPSPMGKFDYMSATFIVQFKYNCVLVSLSSVEVPEWKP
jgi:hypothetical protein